MTYVDAKRQTTIKALKQRREDAAGQKAKARFKPHKACGATKKQ